MCDQFDSEHEWEEIPGAERIELILRDLVSICYDFLDLLREIGFFDESSEIEMISEIQEDIEDDADNE